MLSTTSRLLARGYPARRLLPACNAQRQRSGGYIGASSSSLLPGASFFTEEEVASFHRDGFVVKEDVLSASDCAVLAEHYHELFAGEFPTGVFPDEWHWREGLSLPTAVREIVNGWKASPAIARVALSPGLGRAAASLMRWGCGARLAQDDVLWKPPGAGGVGFHQDSAYISDQFCPRDDNSVTVWIALEDADETTGTVEYAVGSHLWRQRVRADAAERETATSASFHGVAGDLADPVRRAAAAAGLEPSAVTLRAVRVPKGGAIFHHQDVWHGSRPNEHPTRPRRALAVHLLRRDVSFRAAPAPDYIYGRYVLGRGRRDVCDTFFPVTWAPDGSHLRSDVAVPLHHSGLIPTAAGAEATGLATASEDGSSGSNGMSGSSSMSGGATLVPGGSLVPAWSGSGQAAASAGREGALASMVAEWRRAQKELE